MDMIITILKENPLFADFTESELIQLVQCCEKITVPKGRTVFHENAEDDNAAYFIEEGVIKVVKEAEGQRKILAMFGMGNIFGDMSFLSPGPRSATVVTDEDAVLYKLPPAKLTELETRSPYTALKLLKIFTAKLVTRLRQTDDALMQKGQRIIIT